MLTDSSQCSVVLNNTTGSDSLCILCLNIRSIYCNFDLLLSFITTIDITVDVIVLTECWTKKGVAPPNMNDYNMYYTKNNLNQNDGIVAYVRKEISVVSSEPDIVEGNCLQLDTVRHSIICSYRPPSYRNPQLYLTSLDEILKKIQNRDVIFTGDININTLPCDINSSYVNDYLCLMASHGLQQGILFPTRINTCLDHFMVRTRERWQTIIFPELTDHSPILLCIKHAGLPKSKPTFVNKKIDYAAAHQKLREVDWSDFYMLDDANLAAEYLVKTIQNIMNICTSILTKPKRKAPLKPWITEGVVRSIRKRDRLHQKSRKQPDNERLRQIYTTYRNSCNKIIKSLKSQYYRAELEINSNNLKKTWSIIKDICNMKKNNDTPKDLLHIDSTPIKSLNQVNKYFTTIGSELADATLYKLNKTEAELASTSVTNIAPTTMSFTPTDSMEIDRIIASLKMNSAPGPDNVPSRLLMLAKDVLAEPISHLCNLSLGHGIFPTVFKTAIVSPIHKADDKQTPSNYRPISLLSCLSKILEKLVTIKLVSYLEKNKLLTDRQFGFRKGISTNDALLKLTSTITKRLDAGEKVIGVFLDLKKAFDTVSIPILLTKLNSMGVRGHVLQWFQDYLSDREQRVRVDGHLSDAATCTFGIPQGSTTGPATFLTYINSLAEIEIPNAEVIMFADDTVILFHGNTWEQVQTEAESGLAIVTKWLEDNLLTLNASKTKYLCFTKTNISSPDLKFSLKIHTFPCNRTPQGNTQCTCDVLTRSSFVKYLGIIVDENLNWNQHISSLSARLRKLIYIFKQLRNVAPKKLLLSTYKALGECLINYCICSWGGASKTVMIQLERAQRALLKVLMFLPYRHPTTDLYNRTGVLSVRKLYVDRVLRRFHRITIPQLLPTTKRRFICPAPSVKSAFAKRHYNSTAPRIYNKLTIKNAHNLNNHNFRKSVLNWLNNLDYDQTENLITTN